jgi:protein TonB
MPFLSGRTVSCLAILACALAALTLAARAEDPKGATPGASAATPAFTQPAPTNCPKPVYPAEAKQAHWTGVSTVAFLISTDGSVRDARVLRSSGHAVLDDATVSALKGCAFRPAMKNGHTVESWQPLQYVWALD